MATKAFIFLLFLLLGKVHGDKCNFENGICTLVQDKDDDFDWSIGNSDTPTTDTGPSYDHTLGKNGTGHYIFIETSGENSWTAARLSSPKYAASKSICVTFYYHMYGKDAGRLSIFLRQRGKLSAPLWSMTDNQGDEWIKVGLHTRSDIDYQVVFEATRGSGFRSDIALDDVSITNGSCKGKVNAVVSSTSLLDAVIGTKVEVFPGAETLPHLPPSNTKRRKPNMDGVQIVSATSETPMDYIFDNQFVINLMVAGLIFWSIVFILLCYVIWRSSRSKKNVEEVQEDTKVRKSAVSTQIEFDNPYTQHQSSPDKRPEQSDVLFPKTEPDDDEKFDLFKARVGLDKAPSSFKDRYSLTTVDKDLYMYFEDERTSDARGNLSASGGYV